LPRISADLLLWVSLTITVPAEAIGPEQFDGMIRIAAGEFRMGAASGSGLPDEQPERLVLLDAFFIDRHEVTNEAYLLFVSGTGHRMPENVNPASTLWKDRTPIPGIERHPVVNVSWTDASAYCRWAGKRLPTEAEWEKAARGTDQRIYPWGNDAPSPQRANYGKTTWNNHAALVPVGQLEDGKSPYGIYDLAGNVWEWVSDWYDPDYYTTYYTTSPVRNPAGPETGKYKVLRGGSWDLAPENLRSAHRDFNVSSTADYDSPAYRNFNSGFRCAKSP
jgi:formylglycine-generating enzyme required for sulfatase activity